MEFNNKTILISGLIVCSGIAMFLNYEQIALAIVSGLLGYLAKDITVPFDSQYVQVDADNSVRDDKIISEPTLNSVRDDNIISEPVENIVEDNKSTSETIDECME